MAINWLRVADYLNDQSYALLREAEGSTATGEQTSARARAQIAQMLCEAIRAGLADDPEFCADQDQALLCRIL